MTYALESKLNMEIFIQRRLLRFMAVHCNVQSSNHCKGDGNGMVLSESGVEGGWLPDQKGVLGLDDDTIVT
jgi:hypothetical protein